MGHNIENIAYNVLSWVVELRKSTGRYCRRLSSSDLQIKLLFYCLHHMIITCNHMTHKLINALSPSNTSLPFIEPSVVVLRTDLFEAESQLMIRLYISITNLQVLQRYETTKCSSTKFS